jgi:hypothetical protein
MFESEYYYKVVVKIITILKYIYLKRNLAIQHCWSHWTYPNRKLLQVSKYGVTQSSQSHMKKETRLSPSTVERNKQK